jgi:hypothetical protein
LLIVNFIGRRALSPPVAGQPQLKSATIKVDQLSYPALQTSRIKMRLPNAERAFVDVEKLRDYCLSQTHPRGRHKARVFADALGMTPVNAEELRRLILAAALVSDATLAEKDDYGQRYVVDFSINRTGLEARVRTSWIVRRGEDFARLTSCYVL